MSKKTNKKTESPVEVEQPKAQAETTQPTYVKELLEKGSKEERFKVMCKAMLRKDLHEQRQGKK